MHRPRAFTLIELLVVVAIIVALIAILLPSLNRAMDASLRAVCASNAKQCGLAFVTYAADHQTVLPPTKALQSNWEHMLWFWQRKPADHLRETYMGGQYATMLCPVADDVTEKYYNYVGTDVRKSGYISMTNSIIVDRSSFATPEGEVYLDRLTKGGSASALLADTLYHTVDADATHGEWTWRWTPAKGVNNAYGFHTSDARSTGMEKAAGGNVIRLDLSVQWIDITEMKPRIQHNANREYFW